MAKGCVHVACHNLRPCAQSSSMPPRKRPGRSSPIPHSTPRQGAQHSTVNDICPAWGYYHILIHTLKSRKLCFWPKRSLNDPIRKANVGRLDITVAHATLYEG